MKKILQCRIGIGIFVALFLVMSQTIAAPRNKIEPVLPSGTWVQQGTDLNGDGVLNGNESEWVFFSEGVDSLYFTLHVEGGCDVLLANCDGEVGGDVGACKVYARPFEPEFKRRINMGSTGHFGVFCDSSCTDECKFTVSDVRP